MKIKFIMMFFAAALAATLASPASTAEIVKFRFNGDIALEFVLPTKPQDPQFSSSGAFGIPDVTVQFGEQQRTMRFAASPSGGFRPGGFRLFNASGSAILFEGNGDQIFTGPASAPTFKLGTFQLTRFDFVSFVPGTGTLTISAVPEPSTWAMFILGFGAVGITLRRRRAIPIASLT